MKNTSRHVHISPPVALYRVSHFFYKVKLELVSKCISYLNRILFAVWIPGSATIGKSFVLGYWGLGIVIHRNAKIGDNCTVGQNVTIGRNFGDKKVPIIGNDVYIGAGSVVFGEITIGDNVIIGANSVINKSVPSNTTIVGNPMKIINNDRKIKYYDI
jgi:serine O-acetyltransferase